MIINNRDSRRFQIENSIISGLFDIEKLARDVLKREIGSPCNSGNSRREPEI